MSWKLKLLFSLIMTIAITGMHYSGMAAAIYSSGIEMNSAIESTIDVAIAWIVAIATFFIFIVFFFTITSEQMWRAREKVQSTNLDAADDGIIVANNDGTIIHAIPAFYRLIDKTAGDTNLYSLEQFHPDLAKDVTFNRDFLLNINSFTLEVTRFLIQDELQNKSLWFLRDISEKVRAEQKVEFMTYHDTLTKLPNRYKLNVLKTDGILYGHRLFYIHYLIISPSISYERSRASWSYVPVLTINSSAFVA